MNRFYFLFILPLLFASCSSEKDPSNFDFTTTFEASMGTETGTYEEVIEFYEELGEAYVSVSMYRMDKTDSGEPLHLVTFNPNRTLESEFSNDKKQNILLINNGIHPGESDGIDASMILMRDLAEGKIPAPQNTIIAVIPVYNIGGALNRNTGTRTNQNGPKEYGFRGNARNYDLNRDFIKSDTRNSRAFADIFHIVDPDFFIDNHVSNGADYQYTLTHLFTQHNKLGGPLGDYVHKTLMPQLADSLQQKKWDITPYVNVWGTTPEAGFSQFMDYPRYSTGYTSLFHTVGMMVETHMLKPYSDRVQGTYELMKSFISIAERDAEVVRELRKNAPSNYKPGSSYAVNWKIDSTQTTKLSFKGYEGTRIKSEITGKERLKYDREQPFTKEVDYYNYFEAAASITIPEKYIIPEGYWNIMQLLDVNEINYSKVQADTTIKAEVYRIKDYQTRKNPYEGHYAHYNTQVDISEEEVVIKAGDYVVETQQRGVRYILETLEPMAPDSFFNWNFFDTILQQKEGFSPYVWEDKAAEFLENNPEIKDEFESKKATDPGFANNWYAQLDWIHKQSPNYEKAHLRYPIVRVGG